ncbi:MAG: hypothetical protein FWD43_02450 [Coriobacteriia bacterium]|nr:hypothetical protein [Coriobacteriia bacterium]
MMRPLTVAAGVVAIVINFLFLTVVLLVAYLIASETFLVFAVALVFTYLIATTWFVVRENRR